MRRCGWSIEFALRCFTISRHGFGVCLLVFILSALESPCEQARPCSSLLCLAWLCLARICTYKARFVQVYYTLYYITLHSPDHAAGVARVASLKERHRERACTGGTAEERGSLGRRRPSIVCLVAGPRAPRGAGVVAAWQAWQAWQAWMAVE